MFIGIGGVPYGDENDEIELTTCEVVDPQPDAADVMPVLWGQQWTMERSYEVIIGHKVDPFCLATYPGSDSVSIQ